jgi:hypothetical protein
MLNLNLIKLTYKLTKFLFNIDDRSALKLFVKRIIVLLKNNGTLFTVKYLKQAKLHITRYMVGRPLMSNDCGVSLVGGFPKHFLFLRKYIDRGDLGSVKFVLTLLNISRSIVPKKREKIPVSLDTIVAPSKGTGYIIPRTFIRSFLKHYDLHQPKPSYTIRDFHLSMKGGPNGPSSATALYSFAIYSERFREIVFSWTKGSLYPMLFNMYRYARLYFDRLPRADSTESSNRSDFVGRLSIVKDPECKMRVIAMVDYISQFLLKPIHLAYFRCLRKLPCDRTFTQDPRGPWLDNSELFWSLDLSAATDRLPLYLQKSLFSEVFGDDNFSEEWGELLTREYAIPCPTQKSGWEYKEYLGLKPIDFHKLGISREPNIQASYGVFYSVGQPMGAYSSWASLALTHHLIVLWCAHLCGHSLDFNQYIILGDDIVIKDTNVALKYISVMKRLGVDISETKTHVGKTTYEFAKRWIKGGVELTGLPLRGISDNISSVLRCYAILFEYVVLRNNLYLYKGPFVELVIKAFSGLQVRVGNRVIGLSRNYLETVLGQFNSALRWTHGLMSSEEARVLLASHLSHELPIPSEHLVLKLMRSAITEEAVKLSVQTTNRYLDFKENLDKYLNNIVTDFQFPFEGKYVKNMHGIIKFLNIFFSYFLQLVSSPIRLRKGVSPEQLEQVRTMVLTMELKFSRMLVRLLNRLEFNRVEAKRLLFSGDLRHHQYHPTWHGLINHVMRVRDQTYDLIDTSLNERELIDFVKNLIFIDFDELAATERDLRKVDQSISSMFNTALESLKSRRRLVAVSNNMEYIIANSLYADFDYQVRGYGDIGPWSGALRYALSTRGPDAQVRRSHILWSPLARIRREMDSFVLKDLESIERETFRLEKLPNWDW